MWTLWVHPPPDGMAGTRLLQSLGAAACQCLPAKLGKDHAPPRPSTCTNPNQPPEMWTMGVHPLP